MTLVFKGVLAVVFLVITGCSNPFSNSKPNAFTIHTPTPSCNLIHFDEEKLSVKQVRVMIKCLNSNHEVDALDQAADLLSDAEIEPFVITFNDILQTSLKALYAVKEFYFHLKQDGNLKILSSLLERALSNPELNQKLAFIFSNHADFFSRLIFKPQVKFELQSLYQISTLPAYHRWMSENTTSGFLKLFLASTRDYLKNKSALTFKELAAILKKTRADDRFFSILDQNPKVKIQNFSNFFSWLIQDHHLELFSRELRKFQEKPVNCLNQKYSVLRPDLFFAKELAFLNATEAKNFITHDGKTLLLMSHGFCANLPSYNALYSVLSSAANQPWFEDAFNLMQPLLSNQESRSTIMTWLASGALETWLKENTLLIKNNFIGDTLTLAHAAKKLSLLKNSEFSFATSLDDLFNDFSDEEMITLVGFISPFLSDSQKKHSALIEVLFAELSDFPAIPAPHFSLNHETLSASFLPVLKSKQLAAILNLMGEQKKIIPLLEDAFSLFSNYINRGLFLLTFHYSTLPDRDPRFENLETEVMTAEAPALPCDSLNLDWDFSFYSPTQASSYLTSLDEELDCLRTNSSNQNIKTWMHASVSKNYLPYLLDLKQSLVNNYVSLDFKNTVDFIKSFLNLNATSFATLKNFSLHTSKITEIILPALHSLSSIKNIFSRLMLSPESYRSAQEAINTDFDQFTLQKPSPTLDLQTLQYFDLRLDRDAVFKNTHYRIALQKLMANYCPNFDIHSRQCRIDDDQVLLYAQSPDVLIKSIKKEYIESNNTWLHPKTFTTWQHQESPKKTSDFEYHLYPLLHDLKNNPKATQSIVDIFKVFAPSETSLYTYFKDRATHLTLIPYIYQVDRDPRTANREHSQKIRLRIVSDLDQIELIAINADFIALGASDPLHLGNIGLKIITEIGFAMGDLPRSKWPSLLSQFKNPVLCDANSTTGNDSCVRTLLQVRNMVFEEIEKYDNIFMRLLGESNPKFFDLNSRIFNLKRLLRFMDEPGFNYIRDIFYLLHTHSAPATLNHFSDGLNLKKDCLTKPSLAISSCNYDNLELAMAVTRTGLIHQIGLAILQDQSSVVKPSLELIFSLLKNDPAALQNLSGFLNSDAGILSILNITGAAFTLNQQLRTHEKAYLSAKTLDLLKVASRVQNKNWLNFLVSLLKQNPTLPLDQIELFSRFISISASPATESFFSLDEYLKQNPTSSFVSFFNLNVSLLNTTVASESLLLLNQIKRNQPTFLSTLSLLQTLDTTPILTSFKPQINLFLDQLASTRFLTQRERFASWLKKDDFEKYCAVYSDSAWLNQTFNFLDEFHQNPDSLKFIDRCEEFINFH